MSADEDRRLGKSLAGLELGGDVTEGTGRNGGVTYNITNVYDPKESVNQAADRMKQHMDRLAAQGEQRQQAVSEASIGGMRAGLSDGISVASRWRMADRFRRLQKPFKCA
jgi:hypothetical protein